MCLERYCHAPSEASRRDRRHRPEPCGRRRSGHSRSLLTNGDFEAGGGSLAGWTVATTASGSVFAATAAIYNPCCGTSGSEPAFSGNHFAAYDAGNVTGSATLSQTFNSVLGGLYTLTFDLGAFGAGTNTVDVTAQGVTQSFVVGPNNNADTTFHGQSINFTGLGGLQTVAFTVATVSDNTDALLDNAALTGPAGVPEPAAWALLILGFGGTGAMLRRRTLALA